MVYSLHIVTPNASDVTQAERGKNSFINCIGSVPVSLRRGCRWGVNLTRVLERNAVLQYCFKT